MCQEGAQLIDYRGGMGLITILLFGGRPWKSTEVCENGSQTCCNISVAKMHARNVHPLWVPISCSPIWDQKRALAPGPDSHKFAGPRFLSCQHAHTTRLTSGAWRPEQAPRGPTTEETPGGPRRPQGEVPENPEARYAPESPKEAPGRPKETQEAPGDPRKPPGNSRKPQKASRGHRKPQETPRIPKNS